MDGRVKILRPCSVPGCNDKTTRRFTIPTNKNISVIWIERIKNKKLLGSDDCNFLRNYSVCKNHFAEMCIDNAGRLKNYSLPTLNLPDYNEPSTEENCFRRPGTNYNYVSLEKVKDSSDLQLIEDHELLQNLNLYDAKFLVIPDDYGLHVPLFSGLNTFNFRWTERNDNRVSPVPHIDNDLDVENCNNENQLNREIITNRNWEYSERQCITDYQTNAFDTPASLTHNRTEPVEKFVNQDIPTEVEKPYFRSLKSFLQDCNRMTEVCRICFQSLEEEEVIRIYEESSRDALQIKKLLNLVLPDLDLEVYPNTVICVKCAELLMYSYQLKQKWLSTEEKLQKIIEKKKGLINREADLVIIGKRVEKKTVTTVVSEIDHDYGGNPQYEEQKESKVIDALLGSLDLNLGEKGSASKVSVFHGKLSTNNQNQVSKKQFNRRKLAREKRNDIIPYMCEQCGRTYKHIKYFKKHLAIHKNPQKISNQERTFMCETCGQLFKTIQGLKKHTHAECKCTFCDRALETKGKLHHHITSKHLPNSYQCHICGRQYTYRTSLRLHLKIHNPANKTKTCHICDKKFFFASKLKIHLQSHIKEQLTKCDYCGKSLKHRWSLKKHKNLSLKSSHICL